MPDLRVAICALVLAGCTARAPAADATTPSPSRPAIETMACRDRAQVEEWLGRFATAFNSGDETQVRAALSSELWALSFNVLGRNDVAYGRESAVQRVLALQRDGDRLEFRAVQVNELAGWDGAAQIGPVGFTLRRGQAEVQLDGKGAVYCGGPVAGVKVLGLGDPGK